MRNILLVITLIFCFLSANTQDQITVDKIWEDYEFVSNRIPGFNFMDEGGFYSRKENNVIKQYDITTGDFIQDLFDAEQFKDQDGFGGKIDSYTFSKDETKILIKTETEAIYRHSTRASFFVYDRSKTSITKVFNGNKIRYCSFSPDATKLAFVYQNNMYVTNIKDGSTNQISFDGKHNEIINGATDWVYEEEFSFAKAFEWSPDSKYLAFIRFDESEVKEFTYTEYHDDLYPEYKTFKYPKVGEKNSDVDVFIYCLKKCKTNKVALDGSEEFYVPRIKWTQESKQLCVFKMNRHQNHLQLFIAQATSGKTKLLMEEKNEFYINITDNLNFLQNKKHFIWTSEKSGFNHIYLYDMKGNEIKAITAGNFDVTKMYGVDQKNEFLYYQAAKNSPMQRVVYQVRLSDNTTKKITTETGYNSAQFSNNYEYFVNHYSTINQAASYTVHKNNSKKIRVIESNEHIKTLQKTYQTQPVEFMTINTSENIDLNAWIIKPAHFDATKKYPLFMYLYGGPGSQEVLDRWKGMNYWWFQMLTQKGYVVACVDNRGTGARGEAFKKMTYQQLGHYETIDQIESAKYLGSLDYIDEERIGIFGWSYGGYMSSLCLLKGNDVFKAAIAVAPITNWKWYDSIYTERYMRTEKENPNGYKNNSPVCLKYKQVLQQELQ